MFATCAELHDTNPPLITGGCGDDGDGDDDDAQVVISCRANRRGSHIVRYGSI